MQEKFEHFVKAKIGKHYNLKKSGDSYCDSFINALWLSFQAGVSVE